MAWGGDAPKVAGAEELDEPPLHIENVVAAIAFGHLIASRPMGMGPGTIPLSEMKVWFELSDVAFSWELIYKLQTIDAIFLQEQNKRAEEASKTKEPSRSRMKRR